MTDRQFLNSADWNRVRLMVLDRDRYTCQGCGKPAEEVHHKPARSKLDERHWLNPKYCVSLCKSCHSKETNKEMIEKIREANKVPNDGWM